ncbi:MULTISPECIES: dihydropteroate synthase [unclassified Undibacterium]|uniref:dihydropteroate synthase n=1 Tax=unclassified Undibacterium TaxID=2630295 RepID=UPI002AC93BA5|nr:MULTISPECIES: dihydropteroate synthase [unclassified Undibacterium]MEB0138489.1 dihydropteroate synthase [Undibacterium sp. CCC2.1]MEB0173912.1 dihydropteroate synthase [Undibacterium sp. CCC1.1]MEB0176162.1 dihydropteroate synthase [Undibacterium sp. CCC3.4]MEB0215428.1 dihydropteroate synthase [Undibacterium sp. 5I2]WPX42768.1 dihydropteroate synthase [Undibacterium sp. CCC3.4]
MTNYFQCGRYRFNWGAARHKPLVMGILNVTPDSFSDGGQFLDLDSALSRAEQMIEEGVDIIDIGGESSRPGAQALSLEQELARVMPVIFALRDCGKPLSIDTYKPAVMREALLAGADMINDIQGFRSPEARAAVADSEAGLCVMHMQKTPGDMQQRPQYQDVHAEVLQFLAAQAQALQASGIAREQICIDPGFGFGKSLAHNIALFQDIEYLQQELGLPLLVGVSRKTMIGELTGKSAERRLAGSVAAALAAAQRGAKIVRVHDVAETMDALTVWQALLA